MRLYFSIKVLPSRQQIIISKLFCLQFFNYLLSYSNNISKYLFYNDYYKIMNFIQLQFKIFSLLVNHPYLDLLRCSNSHSPILTFHLWFFWVFQNWNFPPKLIHQHMNSADSHTDSCHLSFSFTPCSFRLHLLPSGSNYSIHSHSHHAVFSLPLHTRFSWN